MSHPRPTTFSPFSSDFVSHDLVIPPPYSRAPQLVQVLSRDAHVSQWLTHPGGRDVWFGLGGGGAILTPWRNTPVNMNMTIAPSTLSTPAARSETRWFRLAARYGGVLCQSEGQFAGIGSEDEASGAGVGGASCSDGVVVVVSSCWPVWCVS
jgi:hypothetical protein